MNGTAAAAPHPRAWRLRVGRARRAHHNRSPGDVFTDLYAMAWVAVVYGGALASSTGHYLRSPAAALPLPAERYWVGIAVLLAAAGLAWQTVRSVGPLLATPAEQTWGISTPMDRRGWLLPRFVALLLAGGLGGAVVSVAVSALATHGGALAWSGLGWAALAGSVYGLAGVALAVAAQGTEDGSHWAGRAGPLLMGAGALTAAGGVVARFAGVPFFRPGLPSAWVWAVAVMPLAALAVLSAVRALQRLDLATLGAGAQLAAAALTATVWLDPSLLSDVLEVRRWRQVGRVRSRPFHGGPGGRWWVLLQAEVRRVARHPHALALCAGLALAQYVAALVAPSTAGAIHVLLAFLTANRLTGGLRTVHRSPGLRRAIGGAEAHVRLIHLAVPALGTALWWILTGPAGGSTLQRLDVLLVAGVVAAAYRAATPRPMSYDSVAMDTPLGLIPLEMVLQMARGFDLLAVVMVFQVLFRK